MRIGRPTASCRSGSSLTSPAADLGQLEPRREIQVPRAAAYSHWQSAVSARLIELRTCGSRPMSTSIAGTRATALENEHLGAAVGRCRLYFQTRRWRGDDQADRMTGSGREPPMTAAHAGDRAAAVPLARSRIGCDRSPLVQRSKQSDKPRHSAGASPGRSSRVTASACASGAQRAMG